MDDDDMMESLTSMIGKEWDPAEAARYFDDMEEHPLFADEVPTEGNTNMEALNALIEEDESLLSLAIKMKNRGNSYYKMGRKGFANAVGFYDKGIDYCEKDKHKDTSPEFIETYSSLYANRAAVHFTAKNYRECINDCKLAINVNPKNVKAVVRAANAAFLIKKYEESLSFVTKGLEIDSEEKTLQKLKVDIDEILRKKWEKEQEAMRREREKRESNKKLYDVLKRRGVRMGPPLFNRMNEYNAKIYVDPEGDGRELIWPVLFLVEEYMQSDFVERVHDDAIIGNVLDEMFPNEGEKAPWDTHGYYTANNIEIYFQETYVKQFDWKTLEGGESVSELAEERATTEPEIKKWVQVSPRCTFGQIFNHSRYVVPSFPVLHIVSKISPFYEAFMKNVNKTQGKPILLDIVDKKKSSKVEIPLRTCGYSLCRKTETRPEEYKKCARCEIRPYCSRECQKADWPTHKVNCEKK